MAIQLADRLAVFSVPLLALDPDMPIMRSSYNHPLRTFYRANPKESGAQNANSYTIEKHVLGGKRQRRRDIGVLISPQNWRCGEVRPHGICDHVMPQKRNEFFNIVLGFKCQMLLQHSLQLRLPDYRV